MTNLFKWLPKCRGRFVSNRIIFWIKFISNGDQTKRFLQLLDRKWSQIRTSLIWQPCWSNVYMRSKVTIGLWGFVRKLAMDSHDIRYVWKRVEIERSDRLIPSIPGSLYMIQRVWSNQLSTHVSFWSNEDSAFQRRKKNQRATLDSPLQVFYAWYVTLARGNASHICPNSGHPPWTEWKRCRGPA